MLAARPSKKRPTWNADTIVVSWLNDAGSTSVACWASPVRYGSALICTSGDALTGGAAAAGPAATSGTAAASVHPATQDRRNMVRRPLRRGVQLQEHRRIGGSTDG